MNQAQICENRMMRIWGLLAAAILIPGPMEPAGGQTPKQFDAATIKLNQEGTGNLKMTGGPGTNAPGHVIWRRVWLGDLVSTAFGVELDHISGPSWIMRQGAPWFAFEATMPPETSQHDFTLMLQTFLIEQFRMKLHHEPRMFPACELIAASGGATLKPSADPNAPDAEMRGWPAKFDSDGFLVMPPGRGNRIARIRGGYYATFQNYTMPEFAERVGFWVTPMGSPAHYVIDKTGLTGAYDFKLKFDDDGGAAIQVGPGVQAALSARGNQPEPSGLPNILKALEQQLGLKLVKAKDVPRDTMVIDHVERIPAGN
jgi:uncharacterized protein (TIGR03435 family)